MMNDDLQNRVSLFLDNEMNMDEQRSLMEEMGQNDQIQSMMDREKSFKSYLKSHLSRPNVSPSLIQTIKEKIRISPS